MTAEKWQRLKFLFASAETLTGDERDAFVESHCGADPELRCALDRLLSRHDEAGGFLMKPIARVPEPAVRRAFSRGDVIDGRLQIESLIGAGGMGEVYKALDVRLDRAVAVKVLPRVLDDPEHRKRLEREALAVAALSHPNICRLYDVDTHHGRAYLVFEYLEGQTLAARLREGPVEIAECRRIAAELTAALAYAHEVGVVHRDLKPANIMLTPLGSKVLDFGIAKRQSAVSVSGDSENRVFSGGETVTGQVLGSAAYMSPEQAEGKFVDQRSDVFSFGCVLYEMITGRKAFLGDTPAATLGAVLHSDPTPVTDLSPHVPAAVDQVLRRCLKKNVTERVQSMRELGAALEQAWSVEADTEPIEPRSPALQQSTHATSSFRSWRMAALVATLIAVVAAIAMWQPRMSIRGQPESSAVVLPFTNVGGDEELEYLADGLSESLTNTLSRIPVIRVIARTTAFRYKGQEIDVRKVGRDLNVGVVVTGKLSRANDQLRLQADLIDAKDGAQIWGQQYTTTTGNTLVVQEDIVRNLTARLASTLTQDEKLRLTSHSTRQSDAYDLYLKGRYASSRFTVPDIQRSIAFFRKALEVDPRYAIVYTGLAESYWLLSSMYLRPAEAMTKAKAAAEKALAVDPMLAEAHMSRGVVRGWYEYDWETSARELRRAIDLNPNDATARLWYAWNLVQNGRVREGIAEARIAHELDPLSLFVETGLGQMIAYSGDHHTAIRQLQNVTASDPTFYAGHHFLGTIYVAAKQHAAAIASFERARQLDPTQPQPIAYLAYAREMTGDQQSARALTAELTELSKKRYISGFLFAVGSLASGADEEALNWLEKACEERDDMMGLIAIDPMFERLRTNERFKVLMRKVGFREWFNKAGIQ